MNDNDLNDLFASPHVFDDSEAFEGRVVRGLQLKHWLRHGLIVVAGFTGGLYALAQVVRLPNWTIGGKGAQGLQQAAADTDRTMRVGSQLFDDVRARMIEILDSSAHYVSFMQTPLFFWVSFALCLSLVGLYYAYSQEETI